MTDIYQWPLLGELRLICASGNELVRMDLLRDGDGLQAGAVVTARLLKKVDARGIVRVGDQEAILQPLPPRLTQGEQLTVEVVRSAWVETGRNRLAKVRPTRAPVSDISDSFINASGNCGMPSVGLQEQWEEAFEKAELGKVDFASGSLTFSLTPALLAVDVDGMGESLTQDALTTLAHYLRLWKIGGSVVVDLPEAEKSERAAALEKFDEMMKGCSYERTRINGFGLLQIVLPRRGPSILERARLDRSGTDAIRLLNSALHSQMTGPITLVARQSVVDWIARRPHLVSELSARLGKPVDLRLQPDAGGGYVEPKPSS